MYQLSHLLTEQKTLLGALYNTSILGDDTPAVTETDTSKKNSEEKEEEMKRQKLISIVEKVEGCPDLLNMPNIAFLHEGFFSELDILENTPLRTVCGVLFSDGLMLATSNVDMLVFCFVIDIFSLSLSTSRAIHGCCFLFNSELKLFLFCKAFFIVLSKICNFIIMCIMCYLL